MTRPAGRVGVIVGLPQEAAILRKVLGNATPPLACAGAQPAHARQGATELIAGGADTLLSFGFAGGLDPALQPGAIVVGAGVVGRGGRKHRTDDALAQRIGAGLDRAGCRWSAGLVAGVDQVMTTASAKRDLAMCTGAVIVDMESHAVAEAGQPFAILRVVVDPADRAIPASVLKALGRNGRVNAGVLVAGLLRRPSDITALIVLARDSYAARKSLRCAAAAVGSAFGLV